MSGPVLAEVTGWLVDYYIDGRRIETSEVSGITMNGHSTILYFPPLVLPVAGHVEVVILSHAGYRQVQALGPMPRGGVVNVQFRLDIDPLLPGSSSVKYLGWREP